MDSEICRDINFGAKGFGVGPKVCTLSSGTKLEVESCRRADPLTQQSLETA